jgi:hypothetical protein
MSASLDLDTAREVRAMWTCPTRAEPDSNLPGALCPRIAPSPMVTQRAVANFGNGFDESLQNNAVEIRQLFPV